MEYRLIRERRKTLTIKVERDGSVTVKAPLFISKAAIESDVKKNEQWIEKTRQKVLQQTREAEACGQFTQEEIKQATDRLTKFLNEKIPYYCKLMGVSVNKVTIKNQVSKWGSCSAKKNLNFNFALGFAPEATMDSIVVHELCHLKEMNHSRKFYDLVYKYCPGYDEAQKWLKTEGKVYIQRIRNTKSLK